MRLHAPNCPDIPCVLSSGPTEGCVQLEVPGAHTLILLGVTQHTAIAVDDIAEFVIEEGVYRILASVDAITYRSAPLLIGCDDHFVTTLEHI